MKAFDDQGNEMQEKHYCIICPVEHITEARGIADEFMASIGATPAPMIQIPLKTSEVVTHYACYHSMYDNELRLMSDWIAKQPYEWCSNKVFTLEDVNTSMLGITEASVGDFLYATGLGA